MQTKHYVNDVELTIEYEATPYIPANWHHDQEGGEVEIQGIYFEGQDLTEMLAQWVIDKCQGACEEAAPQAFADAREDHLISKAEAREDERRESRYFA